MGGAERGRLEHAGTERERETGRNRERNLSEKKRKKIDLLAGDVFLAPISRVTEFFFTEFWKTKEPSVDRPNRTEFYRVLPKNKLNLERFAWPSFYQLAVLPSFFYRVFLEPSVARPSRSEFYRVLPSFAEKITEFGAFCLATFFFGLVVFVEVFFDFFGGFADSVKVFSPTRSAFDAGPPPICRR